LETAAQEQAVATGQGFEEVRDGLLELAQKQRYKIDFFERIDGPFYEPKWLGGMVLISINRLHPFYTVLYQDLLNLQGGVKAKEAVDLLLIALSKAELTARDADMLDWYRGQRRRRWSPYLEDAMMSLTRRLEDLTGPEPEEIYEEQD
jgi:hypothetical protein